MVQVLAVGKLVPMDRTVGRMVEALGVRQGIDRGTIGSDRMAPTWRQSWWRIATVRGYSRARLITVEAVI